MARYFLSDEVVTHGDLQGVVTVGVDFGDSK